VEPEHRLEAVARLLSHQSHDREHARRFVDFARASNISLNLLFARLDPATGVPTCAALAVPGAGRTAMFFVSPVLDDHGVDDLSQVIRHAWVQVAGRNIQLGQALLDSSQQMERKALIQAGFVELAALSYLERPLPAAGGSTRVEPPSNWPEGVSVETWQDSMRDEVMALLPRTYEQTLDCPGLRGLRQIDDVLDGHRAAGEFDPALWFMLRDGSRPIGVLMLNPGRAHDTIELVYLGLAPEARRRGMGARLLAHGLSRLTGRRERTITLAVDEQNAPAIALYRRFGFTRVLRRLALICPMARP